MKRSQFLTVLSVFAFVFFVVSSQKLRAQDDEEKKPQTEYEETFKKPFTTVWKCVKHALETGGCLLEKEKYFETDERLYKGKINSVFCVIAGGPDTTLKILEKFSIRVPYIRAANWTSARLQYIFLVTENKDGSTKVNLKGEISGYEEYVTNQFHFFESNGILENAMMENLKKVVAEWKEED